MQKSTYEVYNTKSGSSESIHSTGQTSSGLFCPLAGLSAAMFQTESRFGSIFTANGLQPVGTLTLLRCSVTRTWSTEKLCCSQSLMASSAKAFRFIALFPRKQPSATISTRALPWTIRAASDSALNPAKTCVKICQFFGKFGEIAVF